MLRNLLVASLLSLPTLAHDHSPLCEQQLIQKCADEKLYRTAHESNIGKLHVAACRTKIASTIPHYLLDELPKHSEQYIRDFKGLYLKNEHGVSEITYADGSSFIHDDVLLLAIRRPTFQGSFIFTQLQEGFDWPFTGNVDVYVLHVVDAAGKESYTNLFCQTTPKPACVIEPAYKQEVDMYQKIFGFVEGEKK